ncbi:MAG: rRNA maturation RNase YbeY [Vicinamibacterales bacterium]
MRARRGRRDRRLRVVVTDGRGRPVASGGLGVWLARAAPASADGVVSIALVSDRVIRRLNRVHRGQDASTDVLSFPVSAHAPGGPLLGDVAIATGVARRQARAHGHAPAVELRILALHGLLHLLGYDHETDQGRMARAEARLGRRAGLPAALTARGRRRLTHS